MNKPLTRRQILAAGFTAIAGAASAPGTEAGKRIGFVDYDLTGYHPRVFLKAMREPFQERGYQLAGCHGLLAQKGREWAAQNGVPWFDDISELNAAVDFYMILAPSNPELHLEMCRNVFPFKKPAYVDKTFAPDVAVAQAIFKLADELGTPIQTTSALRYSNVQAYVEKAGRDQLRHMTAWVSGSNFNEYVIHPVELIVSCMGHEAERLMRRGQQPETQLLIDFSNGRTGTVNVFNKTRTKYAASVTTAKATEYIEVDLRQIFVDNLAAVMDFFESGKPNVDRRETMAIMRILDAAKSPASLNQFVSLTE